MVAPARIAGIGAAVAGTGLLASFIVPMPQWAQVILSHASEGALIGFVCDVIAVRSVYRKAHSGFDQLVSGVADTVVDDFIRLSDLLSGARTEVDQLWVKHRNKVERWLVDLDLRGALLDTSPSAGVPLFDRPAVRHALSRCSETLANDNTRARRLHAALLAAADQVPLSSLGVPTKQSEVREKLGAFYNEAVADTLAEWMAGVDARRWLDQDGKPGVLDDLAVRRAVAHLLREVLKDEKQVARLDELARQALPSGAAIALKMLSWLGSPVTWATNEVAEALEAPPKPNSELSRFIREFAACYLGGWEKLSQSERVELAKRALERSVPSWLDTIAASLASHAKDWTLGHVLRTFVTPEAVQGALRSVSDTFARPAENRASASEPVLAEVRAYFASWLDAWHALPEAQRHAAVEQLLDALVPPTITRVAGQLEDLDRLVPEAKQALSSRLRGVGPDGFVKMLQARTQESLDWIKVNGVVYGAGLGGVAGVMTYLFGGSAH